MYTAAKELLVEYAAKLRDQIQELPESYSPSRLTLGAAPRGGLSSEGMQHVAPGAVVAGFRVTSLVAEGPTGTVHLAEDTRRGGRVALKRLAPELARDPRYRARFMRESRAAAGLVHRHVVRVVNSGDDNGELYLATCGSTVAI